MTRRTVDLFPRRDSTHALRAAKAHSVSRGPGEVLTETIGAMADALLAGGTVTVTITLPDES